MARPRESERQNIRREVLTTAKRLFFEEGYHRITMRKIADAVGCSPGAIYLYFASKEEILFELHNEGFALLYRYKLGAAEDTDSALDRLREGGKRYVAFALDHREYYEVMFNMPEPFDYLERARAVMREEDRRAFDPAMKSYEFLKTSVVACQKEGYLKGIDPDDATFMFWSLGHGLASLIIRNRVPTPDRPGVEIAFRAIDRFVDSLSR